MERAEWLRQMRARAEALYDKFSPQYWVTYGFYENAAHLAYLQKFLARVAARGGQPGNILSAGCGAGRYDGPLLEAGHTVLGIDQSAGMLARAREHFPAEQYPQLRYQKMGFQEMDFHEQFDGVICMDALEHVCPEDYELALLAFARALKPGGALYFTVDNTPADVLEAAYRRARARGLPVVMGELVDETDESYAQVEAAESPVSGDQSDAAVYHFYPALEQVRAWLAQAGMEILEEGDGSGYHHFLAWKKEA